MSAGTDSTTRPDALPEGAQLVSDHEAFLQMHDVFGADGEWHPYDTHPSLRAVVARKHVEPAPVLPEGCCLQRAGDLYRMHGWEVLTRSLTGEESWASAGDVVAADDNAAVLLIARRAESQP